MSKWMEALSADERIASARERIKVMVDNLIRVINIHHANQIVSYSDALFSQVPASYGARAFVVFRDAMLKTEFGFLCHFWDPPNSDRNSIPTVISLIQNDEVQARLIREAGDLYRHNVRVTGDVDAVDLPRLNEKLAEEEETRCRSTLAIAVADSCHFVADGTLKRVQDLRHMQIAHSLTEAARKQPEKVKHGDQRHVLFETQRVLELLNNSVRGSSYAWDGTHQIAKRSAEAFWLNAKFDVVD